MIDFASLHLVRSDQGVMEVTLSRQSCFFLKETDSPKGPGKVLPWVLDLQKKTQTKLSSIFYPIERQKPHLRVWLFEKDIWVAYSCEYYLWCLYLTGVIVSIITLISPVYYRLVLRNDFKALWINHFNCLVMWVFMLIKWIFSTWQREFFSAFSLERQPYEVPFVE